MTEATRTGQRFRNEFVDLARFPQSMHMPCFVKLFCAIRILSLLSLSDFAAFCLCRGLQTDGTGGGDGGGDDDPAGFRDLVRSPQIHRQMYKRTLRHRRQTDNHRPRPPPLWALSLPLSLTLSLGDLSHHPTVESVESLANPRLFLTCVLEAAAICQ